MSKEIVNLKVPKVKGVSTVTNPGNDKKGFAQELLETTQEAVKTKAAAQVLGINLNEGASAAAAAAENKDDPLATQIVTNAMNQQTKAIENMDRRADKLEGKVEEANKSVASMQFELLQDQMKQLRQMQIDANEAAKEALAAGAPKDAFGHYNQVKGELETLVKGIKAVEPNPVVQAGMSDATQIRLKELEFRQNQALNQITADNTRAREAFQLQLAEFQDKKELRRLEYQDKRHFREEGIQGVSDIVAALGAGISQSGGPTGTEETMTARPKRGGGGGEEAMGAYVSSFQCSVCNSDVPVAEGELSAKCPNPDCNATFTIKSKEE